MCPNRPSAPIRFWQTGWLVAACLLLAGAASRAEESPATPAAAAPAVRALLVTGGCCHNYPFQTQAIREAVGEVATVEWTVVNEGGTGTRAQIPLYDQADWAKGFAVVVHNACFADTTDADYIRRITAAHRSGTPAMVLHCAMHSYRAAQIDDWREFLGVTSVKHDHQARYPVKPTRPDHPVMNGFPEAWTTPKDELYIVEKIWPGATVLATSASEVTGAEQAVIWVNNYHGTRVFGTTYGHSDETFLDPVFRNLLGRGFLWVIGRATE